jgi:anti-sigma regulatory factor (Ser/Thr protein kinase)
VRAASSMGQLRNAVRAYLLEGYGPAQTLERVNRLLDTLGGGFATLTCLCVDTATGAIRYANAGHPPPLVVGPGGDTRWLEDGLAPPIGAAPGLRYREAEDAIPDGGALVLYTDGLVERRGEPIDTGLDRLAEAASDSPAHAATLAHRLVDAMPGTARPDDVAVLVLSRREAAGEPLVVRLPADATSLAPLRERLRRWLMAQGMTRSEAGDVLLAVGEAASNAVEHPLEPSPPAILVTLARGSDGETRMEIRDHGNWDAEPSLPHRGRGMQIMRAISEGEVVIDRTAGGTTVSIRHRRGER